ncbi:MAG: hypothetical protein KDI56_14390 [Xanthomonadales bacterium]|nr:hypothetical protein [Xanthomonadales bacterium]MCB1635055.1 hypothetical protein [Xanthomonadales bacterium]
MSKHDATRNAPRTPLTRLAAAALSLGWLCLALPAQAQDCTLAGWTESQPQAVNIGSPPTIARYSGQCAIQVTSPSRYLYVNHPNPEASYYARFYYYTGSRTGGPADIFQGRDGSTIPIRVEHDASASSNLLRFSTQGSATQRSATVQANKWYAIELAWTTGAGSGALNITVTGAGVSTPLSISPITGLNNSSQRIRTTRMGWITAGGSGAINFDAFEARRDGPPGRLCRGDANGNGAITASDGTIITNEFVNGTLALGQPDCNENGVVSGADATCAVNRFVNEGGICP